jgi:hypothetical protein
VPPTFIDDLAVANRDIIRLNPQGSVNLEAANDGSRRRDHHVADLLEGHAIADARALRVWKTYQGRSGGQRHGKVLSMKTEALLVVRPYPMTKRGGGKTLTN